VKAAIRGFTIVGLTLASAVGCSGTDKSRPPPATATNALDEVVNELNARCPSSESAKTAREPGDALFVEAAIFDVPRTLATQVSLDTLSYLTRDAQVLLVGTPHVVGKFGQKTEMALASNGETNEQVSLARWSMVPQRADGSVVLELELELAAPTSKRVPVTSPRMLKFSMTAHENEPVLARVVWDEASRRSLLILLRTFEVGGEQDLRAIFQCKMQLHAAAVSRPRAGSR